MPPSPPKAPAGRAQADGGKPSAKRFCQTQALPGLLFLLVARRIHVLTKLNRETPPLPALTVFSQEEVEALFAIDQQQAILPPPDLTLGEAIRMVAKLGGFLARKGKRHPGTVTIWRGLQRLKDITFGWRLARTSSLAPPSVKKLWVKLNSDEEGVCGEKF